jgi:hypothetical protein
LIESIKINFSFGKLLKNLDKILEENMYARKKIVVEYAKDVINSGKLRRNKKSTLLLKGEGLKRKNKKTGQETRIYSPKSPKGIATGSTTPLIHTGSLRASFKVVDDGIQMAKHGIYHLNDYKISGGSGFAQMHLKKAIGKTVKKRNFLPFTEKGNYKGGFAKKMKKIDRDLYKGLKRAMRK